MNAKEEIKRFIEIKENPGALLLTGEWGCGKTHLINSIAEEYNKGKEFLVCVVSLFGVRTSQELEQKTKYALLCSRLHLRDKGKKVIEHIAKGVREISDVASDVTKKAEPIHTALSINISDFVDINEKIGNRRLILVFDDLERCITGELLSILGSINDYCENKHIKVIIVAAEGKICDNNEDIMAKYKLYREKIICRTITMKSDYDHIIDEILETYNESYVGYRDFLMSSSSLLQLVFRESTTNNIRVLKYIIMDFERVYQLWKESGIPMKNMPYVLYTYAAKYYKNIQPKQEQTKESTTVSSRYLAIESQREQQFSLYESHNSAIRGLDLWVKGDWCPETILESLKCCYAPEEIGSDIMLLSSNIFELTQHDIVVGMPKVMDCAIRGELCCDDVLALIKKIHLIRKYGIELPCAIDYQQILEGVEKRLERIKNGELNETAKTTFVQDDEIDDEAKKINELIERFEDYVVMYRNRKEYLDYLAHPDMTAMYRVCSLNYLEFDDEMYTSFIHTFKSSNNRIKRELILCLSKMFKYEARYCTKDNALKTILNFEKLCQDFYHMNEIEEDAITKVLLNSASECIEKQAQDMREVLECVCN